MNRPTDADSAQSRTVRIVRVDDRGVRPDSDEVAIEEPLTIEIEQVAPERADRRTLLVTMRTPGHDEELAAGFLLGERIVRRPAEILSSVGVGAAGGAHRGQNTLRMTLSAEVTIDWSRLDRHFHATSSCGLCGRASIDALEMEGCGGPDHDAFVTDASVITALPEAVRALQRTFDRTGGLHAAALATADGEIVALREDVGRHNAVDKVLGAEFLAGNVDLSDRLLMLSGRTSFELVQKAIAARGAVVASVGAPSSLAIELAARFGVTLVGFVRDGRFNLYHGGWRLRT